MKLQSLFERTNTTDLRIGALSSEGGDIWWGFVGPLALDHWGGCEPSAGRIPAGVFIAAFQICWRCARNTYRVISNLANSSSLPETGSVICRPCLAFATNLLTAASVLCLEYRTALLPLAPFLAKICAWSITDPAIKTAMTGG